ncbi:hypothetical protein BGX24_010347, partial [Mortierella sp. AD032]
MISIIPLLSLTLTLSTVALGRSNEKTDLKYCQDSAHKKYFKSKGSPVGNSTVPSFTGSLNNRFCFDFGANFVKKSFPDKTQVGITVYSIKTTDLIWNDRQPLCNNFIKAPASVCSASATSSSSPSSVPNPKTDESVISGCIDLATTDLKADPN